MKEMELYFCTPKFKRIVLNQIDLVALQKAFGMVERPDFIGIAVGSG